jgi:hypothetical protein
MYLIPQGLDTRSPVDTPGTLPWPNLNDNNEPIYQNWPFHPSSPAQSEASFHSVPSSPVPRLGPGPSPQPLQSPTISQQTIGPHGLTQEQFDSHLEYISDKYLCDPVKIHFHQWGRHWSKQTLVDYYRGSIITEIDHNVHSIYPYFIHKRWYQMVHKSPMLTINKNVDSTMKFPIPQLTFLHCRIMSIAIWGI